LVDGVLVLLLTRSQAAATVEFKIGQVGTLPANGAPVEVSLFG
jgi:hypothetical protein